MPSQNDIIVGYTRRGDHEHVLSLDSAAMPDIHIEYANVPEDQRGGTATKLVAGAALYCYASTLVTALTTRGASIRSMSGRATAERDRDEHGRSKVTKIKLEIDVDVSDEDEAILDRCQKIMKAGCLITYSFAQGIPIEYEMRRLENE